MHELARIAIDAFGRIDIWINAAASMVYGEFEETPEDVYRQVIETNLFGQIHGARAALPYFRERGRGTLINIASVWGSVTSPYVSAYLVSKFGVRAFSECLQESLWLHERTRDIHVCTILPQSVDTPIFRHAGNYTGRRAKAVPPVIDPDRVVRAIVRSIERPRRRRTVGWFGRLLELEHTVCPGLFNRLVPTVMTHAAFGGEPAAAGPGNVFEPLPELNRVDGGVRSTRVRVAFAAAGGVALAAAAAAVILGRSTRG